MVGFEVAWTDTREVYGRDYESDRNGGWGTTKNKVCGLGVPCGQGWCVVGWG